MAKIENTGPRKPPVLILGGTENALSLTRSLGRRGIDVYAAVPAHESVRFSRYCTRSFPLAASVPAKEQWCTLLFGPTAQRLSGSLIFPCSDEAVEFVAQNRHELQCDYVLDDATPEIQLAMLDKKNTLQLARSAGVAVPNFWEIEHLRELENILPEILFPVVVKPIHSHLFQKIFPGRRYLFANNAVELRKQLRQALTAKLKIMISEFIPGPDALLSSYYTYMDAGGKPLFHFTKKIIRRFLKNQGLACYHQTEWSEEVMQAGLKFFEGIHYRGFGNVEFKRDVRDGKLKIIECNPRLTAAQELLARSGMDVALLMYNHMAGFALPNMNGYQQGLRLWFPVRDFRSYLELRRMRELSFFGWIKSVCHKNTLPFFKWSDPLPSLFRLVRLAVQLLIGASRIHRSPFTVNHSPFTVGEYGRRTMNCELSIVNGELKEQQ
ncbi:MAG: carboxylate--amine ligase [bacterium]